MTPFYARLLLGTIVVRTACSRSGGGSADNASQLSIAQQREPSSLNPALENGQSST